MPWQDARCVFSAKFAADSMAALKAMLSVDNVLNAGCRVKRHPGACVLCVRNNDCSRIPVHVNCFPADTEISAGPIVRAYRRWYVGDLVSVSVGELVLRGTSNHPVLTGRGWVALGGLVEGDFLATDALGQCIVDSDRPARIGDVFDALLEKHPSGRAPFQADQFHGDGHGDVDVVTVEPGVSVGVEALPEVILGSSLARVVEVRASPFEGYVYNLETASGWYFADSVAASNCRCEPEPYLTSLEG